MFKAQCGSRCVLRCSRLNAALYARAGKSVFEPKQTFDSS